MLVNSYKTFYSVKDAFRSWSQYQRLWPSDHDNLQMVNLFQLSPELLNFKKAILPVSYVYALWQLFRLFDSFLFAIPARYVYFIWKNCLGDLGENSHDLPTIILWIQRHSNFPFMFISDRDEGMSHLKTFWGIARSSDLQAFLDESLEKIWFFKCHTPKILLEAGFSKLRYIHEYELAWREDRKTLIIPFQ